VVLKGATVCDVAGAACDAACGVCGVCGGCDPLFDP
jgi:hypothetical protein